jgi:hypothetical protein
MVSLLIVQPQKLFIGLKNGNYRNPKSLLKTCLRCLCSQTTLVRSLEISVPIQVHPS